VFALLCVLQCAKPTTCQADFTPLLAETWEEETVGDTANQLLYWEHEPAYGNGGPELAVIVADAGWPFGKFLVMNPPNPPPWGEPSSMGLCTKGSYTALAPSSVLSIRSKILLSPSDGNGGGVIGFARAGAPLWGYGLAVSRVADGMGGYRAALEIHEFNGLLTSLGYGYQVVLIDPTDAAHVYTYELRARFGASSISFEVYWDNTHVPELDADDVTPVTFSGSAIFSLAANSGQKTYFDDFLAAQDVSLVGVESDGGDDGLSGDLAELTVVPCPFVSSTALRYRLSRETHVRLEIFDAEGCAVRSMEYGRVSKGVHAAEWNGTDSRGRATAAGTYFARLSAGARSGTRLLIRIR
jgi:hypothetical protein